MWLGSQRGCYSVHSGYWQLTSPQGCATAIPPLLMSSWKKLWHVKVAGKVKDVVWRMCRNILPMRLNLRGHQVDLVCEEYEDVVHLFFKCTFLICIKFN